MKTIYFLILTIVSVSACASESGIRCISTGDEESGVSLSVVPKELSKGDSFRLFFPKTDFDHPLNFAVTNPNGDYFIVVDDSVSGSAMSSEEFKTCQVIEVNTSALKGVTWGESGEQVSKNIFGSFGKYELYFTDDLETEATNTFSITTELELR